MGSSKGEATRRYAAVILLAGLLYLIEIVVSFFYYNWYALEVLVFVGWASMLIGTILMLQARHLLETKGCAPGQNWTSPTVLLDCGVYGIVRHPIYLGFMGQVVGFMIVSQYWVTVLLGLFPLATLYAATVIEDEHNLAKFGEAYERYAKRVPGLNLLAGIVRALKRRGGKRQ